MDHMFSFFESSVAKWIVSLSSCTVEVSSRCSNNVNWQKFSVKYSNSSSPLTSFEQLPHAIHCLKCFMYVIMQFAQLLLFPFYRCKGGVKYLAEATQLESGRARNQTQGVRFQILSLNSFTIVWVNNLSETFRKKF